MQISCLSKHALYLFIYSFLSVFEWIYAAITGWFNQALLSSDKQFTLYTILQFCDLWANGIWESILEHCSSAIEVHVWYHGRFHSDTVILTKSTVISNMSVSIMSTSCASYMTIQSSLLKVGVKMECAKWWNKIIYSWL